MEATRDTERIRLIDLLADLTSKELSDAEKRIMDILNTAKAIHKKADREASRIWRKAHSRAKKKERRT